MALAVGPIGNGEPGSLLAVLVPLVAFPRPRNNNHPITERHVMSKNNQGIAAGGVLLILIVVGLIVLATWAAKGLWTFVCWSWGLV